MCANSGCRDYFETLTEMKDHINEHHRKNAPAHYTFSYWVVDSKDTSEKEIKQAGAELGQAQLKLRLDFY